MGLTKNKSREILKQSGKWTRGRDATGRHLRLKPSVLLARIQSSAPRVDGEVFNATSCNLVMRRLKSDSALQVLLSYPKWKRDSPEKAVSVSSNLIGSTKRLWPNWKRHFTQTEEFTGSNPVFRTTLLR